MRLLQRFSLLSLAAGTLSLAVACGDQGAQQPGSVSAPPGGVTDCTVSVDKATGTSRVEKFPAGTDCEAMRKLAAEGKPLPTIGAPKAATAVAPTTAPKFAAPFVTGRDNKTELIEPTDAKARTQELENAIASPDDKKIRDPFGSSILNPVPDVQKILDDERRRKENIIRTEAERKERQEKLREAIRVRIAREALERQRRVAAKPKPRPRTDEAEAVRVTGTVELNGTVYAIVSAPEEPSSRYVRAGQDLSAGKVLVKRIDTNAVPPIVVLQQNGIEVLRAVGAPVVAKVPSAPAAATPAPQAMPPQ